MYIIFHISIIIRISHISCFITKYNLKSYVKLNARPRNISGNISGNISSINTLLKKEKKTLQSENSWTNTKFIHDKGFQTIT